MSSIRNETTESCKDEYNNHFNTQVIRPFGERVMNYREHLVFREHAILIYSNLSLTAIRSEHAIRMHSVL